MGLKAEYQLRKRKEFEGKIRRKVEDVWIKYAMWEEPQNELDRSHSVFERALLVDSCNPNLWLKYAEFEMRNKFAALKKKKKKHGNDCKGEVGDSMMRKRRLHYQNGSSWFSN